MTQINTEATVRERYSKAANEREEALCCPVEYDPKFLQVLPAEIIERDYGCGDPSKFIRERETVLDLGSGGGKICYIASQIVGPAGRVIGVDTNSDMLGLARKYQKEMSERIGFANVEFRYGKIQDLRLDLDVADDYLKANPITTAKELSDYEAFVAEAKLHQPMIEDESIDVIISNCVLNLLKSEDKKGMFAEMFRVLKRGGRVAISDIVSDEDVPEHLQADPKLWSGCISGTFREDRLIEAFEEAGFYGIQILERDEKPWRVVEGIEFRSLTVAAFKGKQGECWERNQAVIYKGPWKKVIDDDGHILERGARMAVCDKTFQIYNKEPYVSQIIAVEPLNEVPLEDAAPFECRGSSRRDPRETKGQDYRDTETNEVVCSTGTECC